MLAIELSVSGAVFKVDYHTLLSVIDVIDYVVLPVHNFCFPYLAFLSLEGLPWVESRGLGLYLWGCARALLLS